MQVAFEEGVTYMTDETIQKWKGAKRTFVLSSGEKANLMRLIDEYDFVQKVLKYRTATMPDDLVQELKHQNDANREMIRRKLSDPILIP